MEIQKILENVAKEKLKQWLTTAGMPFLREPFFFEDMGFSPCFVRQFLTKHRFVLLPGGTIQRKVRGVNEVDFLYGLAAAMGIDILAINRKNKSSSQASAIARECLRVLENADKEIGGNKQKPIVVAKEARWFAAVQSNGINASI